MGNIRSPIYMTNVGVVSLINSFLVNKNLEFLFQAQTSCSAIFLSFVLGYILCLFIETPIATLQKYILNFSQPEGNFF